jgi:hypothetical protein
MADDAFNPLFQDAQVLKHKRKAPAGVSAVDKHRSVKGTVSGKRPDGTNIIADGSNAQVEVFDSPAKAPGSTRTPSSITQNADSVAKQMLDRQRAACNTPNRAPVDTEDAFDAAFYKEAAPATASAAANAAVTEGQLNDEDFDF